MELNINEIKKIIPHRHPFLLVDRVLEIESGKKIKGIKAITYNEPFFKGHYPEKPIMPGVLIVEALAQLGAIAILSEPELQGKTPLFAGINKTRFKKQVIPGDLLILEMELIKRKANLGIAKGIASVDGKKACEAELVFFIE